MKVASPAWVGVPADRAADRAALREVLSRVLAEAEASSAATLVSVIVPVGDIDPVSLFAAAEALGQRRALWLQPTLGFALVGLGEAWSIRATGPDRFDDIATAWSALVADSKIHGVAPSRGRGPLLLGGLGFADEPARGAVWRSFASAEAVLPALLLTISPEGAWLTASALRTGGHADERTADSLAGRWAETIALVGHAAAGAPRGPLRLAASRPGAREWRASVARLAGAVGRGRLDKVVLARQVDLVARTPISIPDVLERLRSSAPGSTTFAIAREGRTFLGASPERLVDLEGLRFSSVAMAGSVRRGADAAADEALATELLTSDKEREEHGVVVDMLRATLAPLSDELDIPLQPHVERLRHLQHLVTPVRGRLRAPIDVLRLAGLLHPTPAVGGMPRELALDLIAEEETIERGWYAGPLGWVDGAGDGELVVALRSGVVEGCTATLMAGCGIVADSDPDREWQESTTKLLALGSALGRVEA